MKRYWLFEGDDYYPCGGLDDLEGSFDSIKEALDVISMIKKVDWWHIVDSKTGEVVAKG